MTGKEFELTHNRVTMLAFKILVSINFIITLLSLSLLILLLVAFIGPVQTISPFVPAVSPTIFYVFISFFAFMALFSLFAIYALYKHNKQLFLCHAISNFFIILFIALVGFYALLYTNDIHSLTRIDNFLSNTQEEFEESLVHFAEEEPEEWKELQDTLKCCGVDAQAILTFGDFNKTLPDFCLSQLTGEHCDNQANNPAFINLFQSIFNQTLTNSLSDVQIEQIVADSGILTNPDAFFCKDKLGNLIQEFTPYIGALIAVLFFLQLIYIYCGVQLLISDEFFDGYTDYDYIDSNKSKASPKGNFGQLFEPHPPPRRAKSTPKNIQKLGQTESDDLHEFIEKTNSKQVDRKIQEGKNIVARIKTIPPGLHDFSAESLAAKEKMMKKPPPGFEDVFPNFNSNKNYIKENKVALPPYISEEFRNSEVEDTQESKNFDSLDLNDDENEDDNTNEIDFNADLEVNTKELKKVGTKRNMDPNLKNENVYNPSPKGDFF